MTSTHLHKIVPLLIVLLAKLDRLLHHRKHEFFDIIVSNFNPQIFVHLGHEEDHERSESAFKARHENFRAHDAKNVVRIIDGIIIDTKSHRGNYVSCESGEQITDLDNVFIAFHSHLNVLLQVDCAIQEGRKHHLYLAGGEKWRKLRSQVSPLVTAQREKMTRKRIVFGINIQSMIAKVLKILDENVLNQLRVVDEQTRSICEIKSDDFELFTLLIKLTVNFRNRLLQSKQISDVTYEELWI